MRILTVRQPWAQAINYGGKDVENRTRNIAGDYRGPVLIHAGLTRDDRGWVEFGGYRLTQRMNLGHPYAAGAIIGVVDLVDVHTASVIGGCGRLRHDCPDHGSCRVHCSEWAQGPSADGWFQHLVFANPRALDEPIPYKGGLGLRNTSFGIAGDWLYEETDRCTCGVGNSIGALYGHEPGCGLEPVARLQAATR